MANATNFRRKCVYGTMLFALGFLAAKFFRDAGNRENDFGQLMMLAMVVSAVCLAGCVLAWFFVGVRQASAD